VSKRVAVTIVDGPDRGQTFSITTGVIRIGRAKADMTLSDKKVSAKHCEIGCDGEQVWVDDLQSTNGTFVGSQRVTDRTYLKNLDEVVVGLTRISVAIVDELQAFKESNQTSGGVSFDLDDISGAEDQIVDGLLEESEHSMGTQTARSEGTKTESVGSQKKPLPEVKLPPPEAVYRETGIQRIDNLIKDELDTFSKWDHPGESESKGKSVSVPKVKVILSPRRGPEGIGVIECTKASTSFGRKDVDVRLNDLDCSRKHASVEIVAGSKAFVRDLASTNGTYVNGKKISYQEVKSGDLVQIGQTIFEVTVEGGS